MVSHVTPIKILVAHALGAPLEAVFRMELSPASVSVVSYYPAARRHRAGPRCGSTTRCRPGNDAFGGAVRDGWSGSDAR